jgi:hypothetical protein
MNITGLPHGSGMSAQRVWEWIEWPLFAGASGERRMKKTILVVGFACLSMVAVAQSTSDKKAAATSTSTDNIAAPRDIATGHASGKVAVSHEIKSPRDSASGASSGRVAAADVNGDGKATVHASAQASTIQSPKEVSTGKATGKTSAHDDWEAPKAKTAAPVKPTPSSNPPEQRMHKPLTTTSN